MKLIEPFAIILRGRYESIKNTVDIFHLYIHRLLCIYWRLTNADNKALHRMAIPLGSIVAGVLGSDSLSISLGFPSKHLPLSIGRGLFMGIMELIRNLPRRNNETTNRPPSGERRDSQSANPTEASSLQAAVLVASATSLLIEVPKIEPKLHDSIVQAVSIIEEGIRPLAGKGSEKGTMDDVARIIKEITLNLTGDGEKDSKYLMEQMEKYKQHGYIPEILRTIIRIFHGFLPEERKTELHNRWRNEAIYTQVILSEAKSKLAQHNVDEAEELIRAILPSEEIFQDETSEYYDFRNSLEWAYFMEKNRPSKKIMQFPISYNDVFMTYVYILVEKEDYNNAIRAIDLGLAINPLNVDLMFEKSAIYKTQKRYDESFQISRDCFDISYTRATIARCYRDFGYYFIEKKNWDAAICCYMLSDDWFPTEKANSELFFITQQTKKIVDREYYAANLQRILEENSVPPQPNPLWIQIALYMGERAATDDIEQAKFCYQVAYELTGDESFHEKILDLNRQLQ